MKVAELRACIRRTLTELANDITSRHPEQASVINTTLREKTDKALIKELSSSSSPLVQNIPVETLSLSEGGKRYLEVLAIIQPVFKDISSMPSTSKSAPSNEMQWTPQNIPEVTDALQEQINALMSNQQLVSLAKGMVSDLKIEPQNLKMEDILGLAGQMKGYLEEKQNQGEIDLAQLETQCKEIGQQFLGSEDARELLSKFNVNPEMLNAMAGMMDSDGADSAEDLLKQLD